MRLISYSVMFAAMLLSGCGPAAPQLEATWTDSEDRVFVEFSKNEVFFGEKKMKLRFACGTYSYLNADTVEIVFNESGKKVRKYAKDPKKGVSIIHDSFASLDEQEKLQDIVQISFKLKGNSLDIQAKGKPVVTWQLGESFKF